MNIRQCWLLVGSGLRPHYSHYSHLVLVGWSELHLPSTFSLVLLGRDYHWTTLGHSLLPLSLTRDRPGVGGGRGGVEVWRCGGC